MLPDTTDGVTVALDVTTTVPTDVVPATTPGDGRAPPLVVGVGMLVEPATTDGVAVALVPPAALMTMAEPTARKMLPVPVCISTQSTVVDVDPVRISTSNPAEAPACRSYNSVNPEPGVQPRDSLSIPATAMTSSPEAGAADKVIDFAPSGEALLLKVPVPPTGVVVSYPV